jgi:hypothetical protein
MCAESTLDIVIPNRAESAVRNLLFCRREVQPGVNCH